MTGTVELRERLRHGPTVLLDGGMGTALLARGLDPAHETAASWNLRHPDVVLAVHREHVAAGAELVLTNTFGAHAPAEAECDAAVRLARESGARWVGASLWAGAPDLASAVEDLVNADLIWLETATSGPQALAALAAVRRATKLPVVVTLASFRDTDARLVAELRSHGADAAGLNCSPWPREPGSLALVAARTAADVIKPDGAGMDPLSWAREVARTGAPLLGGCCGATGAHLAALRDELQRTRATPR